MYTITVNRLLAETSGTGSFIMSYDFKGAMAAIVFWVSSGAVLLFFVVLTVSYGSIWWLVAPLAIASILFMFGAYVSIRVIAMCSTIYVVSETQFERLSVRRGGTEASSVPWSRILGIRQANAFGMGLTNDDLEISVPNDRPTKRLWIVSSSLSNLNRFCRKVIERVPEERIWFQTRPYIKECAGKSVTELGRE